jgi:hypothetical protein
MDDRSRPIWEQRYPTLAKVLVIAILIPLAVAAWIPGSVVLTKLANRRSESTPTSASPASNGAGILVTQDLKTVWVWKDNLAHDEGLRLLQAGQMSRELIRPLLACAPKAGTTAVIVDRGVLSHTVLVTDGPHTGCRGFVPAEHFVAR